MFKSTTTGLTAVAFAAMASASIRIEPFPEATGAMALPNANWAREIEPTAAPIPPHRYARGSLDFAERADPSDILVAPDATCGYISGRQGAEYTCVGDYSCALFPAQGPTTGNVACCNSAACNIRKACINYDEYYSSSSCDDACRVDGYTVKCLNTDYPYCNTVSFSGSVFDYWCNGISMSTPQGVQTTYDGQKRVFKTSALSDESETLTITDNTSQAGVTVTVQPSETSTNDSNSDNSNDSGKKDSGPPIGAIVGGVVGGVAAIGIAALALWWFLRKKKQNNAAPTTPATVASAPAPGGVPPQQPSPAGGYPAMSQMPPSAGGYSQNGFYDPKFAAAGAPPPGAPYSPQNAYPQQNGAYFPPSAYAPSTTSPTLNNVAPTGTTPSPGNQHPGFNQPPVIHEAPANTAEMNRDLRHELA